MTGLGSQQGTSTSAAEADRDHGHPFGMDRRRAVALVVLAIAVVYFAWRGIAREWLDSGDFAVAFGGGWAWLVGSDPYSVPVLEAHLATAGASDRFVTQLETLRNVFAPTTLPLFAPIGLLAWAPAVLLWLFVNVGAALAIAFGLTWLLEWRPGSTRAILLVAAVLALAPVHSTMASGQTGLAATAALVLGVVAQRRASTPWAAVLYALAVILKAQIGLPFLVYLVWRRWRTAAVATAILVGATALAVGRLAMAGVPWLASWSANLALLSGPGGINDPGPLNEDRYSLVNLQYPLHTLLPPWAGDQVTYLVIGWAIALMVWLHSDREPRFDLLAMSTVAVLALLVTYHRYYDAVVLAFPIAWAIANIRAPRRAEAIVVLVLAADFVLPAQTALHDLQVRGLVPDWLVANPVWDALLLAQHTWALVLMALALLWAGWRDRSAALKAELKPEPARIAG